MKKITPWLAGAYLLASLFVTGCHSSRQLVSSSPVNHNPQFLDSITLGGNNANHVTNNAITSTGGHKRKKHKKHTETNPVIEKYASLLGVDPVAITDYNLYSFIDEWYGVNYLLGGNDKNGIDCSAFVQRLYQEVFGTNKVRTAIEQFNNCSLKNDINNLKEGDLVFFHINSSRITHVGIYLANNFFVHASVSKGVTISSLNDNYWQKAFAGAGEIPINPSAPRAEL
jgi:cell wall-associated NlpC family hydrolase